MRHFTICLALMFLVPTTGIAGTRTIDGHAVGQYHTKISGWKEVPIVVYVDDRANTYISSADGGIKTARGLVSREDLPKVIALLKKSQNWVKTAKANELEATKSLGDFKTRESRGQESGVALQFFAANKGQQTDVILSIADFDNMFYKMDVYMNPEQVRGLLNILSQIPATRAELKRQESAAALLQ